MSAPEKARVIRVFRNGDKHDKGVDITLNLVKIPTHDQLKAVMTERVRLLTGPVLKVYTVDGQLVRSLESYEDGAFYVACGGEPLDTQKMSQYARGTKSLEEELIPEEEPTKKFEYKSPMEKREIQKFGLQEAKARVILVFRNGDKHDKGTKIILNMKRIPTLELLYQHLNDAVRIKSGTVRKVYTPSGHAIRHMDDFVDGERYIAAGAEGLDVDKLSPYALGEVEEDEVVEEEEPTKKFEYKSPMEKREIKKFGTQAAKAKVIFVFRNGDPHHKGEKTVLNLKTIPTMDHLLQKLTVTVQIKSGAVRKLYTVEGRLVRSMDDFEDGNKYIACGGEPLDTKKMSGYATGEMEADMSVTAEEPEKKKVEYRSPVTKKPIQKFGLQTSKARVITVFRNGDVHHKGERVVLNENRIPTYDVLRDVLTKQVRIKTGAVRKLYTPEGRMVRRYSELQDGGKYIACGGEPLDTKKMSGYATGEADEEEKKMMKSSSSSQSSLGRGSMASPSRSSLGGSRSSQPIQKFGTQAEKARVITVYRNGDKYDKGTKITINPKRIRTHDQLKAAMTSEVRLLTGAVKKVYTATGQLVRSYDDYKDGGKYVACGGEGLDTKKMPAALKGGSKSMSSSTSSTSSQSSEPRKVEYKSPVKNKEIKKFGTQVAKAKIIFVFRNGDKHDQGTKIILNTTRMPTHDHLKAHMTRTIGLLTGAVKKVYTADGKLVRDLDSYADQGRYIACGGESLDKAKMPLALRK